MLADETEPGNLMTDPRQLRVLFAGRGNAFNRGIVNWLCARYCVVGAFFLEPNRHSLAGRLARLRRRMRTYGIVPVLDEVAFHVFDRIVHGRRHRIALKRAIPQEFLEKRAVHVPQFAVDNLHSEQWLAKARELRPDIIFSVCAAVIFREAFYSIPPLGTFVLHEGITPEYRGLHTPLWAMLNKDYEFLGYTLLKVDDSIDGGEILAQRRYDLEPGDDFVTWPCVGHKAILRGLPEIESALNQLAEDRGFTPLPQVSRTSRYYTWMRLSQYLKLRNSCR